MAAVSGAADSSAVQRQVKLYPTFGLIAFDLQVLCTGHTMLTSAHSNGLVDIQSNGPLGVVPSLREDNPQLVVPFVHFKVD